jgi:hypothetical protein
MEPFNQSPQQTEMDSNNIRRQLHSPSQPLQHTPVQPPIILRNYFSSSRSPTSTAITSNNVLSDHEHVLLSMNKQQQQNNSSTMKNYGHVFNTDSIGSGYGAPTAHPFNFSGTNPAQSLSNNNLLAAQQQQQQQQQQQSIHLMNTRYATQSPVTSPYSFLQQQQDPLSPAQTHSLSSSSLSPSQRQLATPSSPMYRSSSPNTTVTAAAAATTTTSNSKQTENSN